MVRAMTTLKPQLVRADTLDLQDPHAPSAKDHTRQPGHPSPYGYGSAAPHQAQSLRHAEQEAYQQQHSSPRASEERVNGGFAADQHFYDDLEDDRDDEQLNSQNGANGYHGQDPDEGDGGDSHDEDMDDDLMDKISSSPSIEDGKYALPPWPPRADSVDSGASPASKLQSTPTRGIFSSSSPFSSTSEHLPLHPLQVVYAASHHGEYAEDAHLATIARNLRHQDHSEPLDRLSPTRPSGLAPLCNNLPLSESQEFRRYLLPHDGDLLADTFEGYEETFVRDEDDDWEDEDCSLPDPDSSSDDDDSDEFQFTPNDRFIDSGWGGECLRETEDIDFEFVYALHTFVATVEGQANATKGDTMVLLDDSNSYWWLVRVVKDGSIGYLPAEHIETPTERLARLNKHRNVDLSASMLGDNTEKSKNPLKKAMRRRNAKAVQFAAPTYYEPSEYDYSDEEEEGEESQMDQLGVENPDDADQGEDQQEDSTNSTEAQESREPVAVNGIQRVASNDSVKNELSSSPTKGQQSPFGLEHKQSEEPVQRSRKGVVRNTDSFFKDDTVETKKISLTPRLLRGDSDSGVSTEQEVRQRPSLETFDKMVGVDDKSKDKKKEKKGMLSGLFKRKKGPVQDEVEKVSEDSRQSPSSKDSTESLSMKPEAGPERRPSKLHKTPPYTSPKTSPTEARAPGQREVGSTSQAAPPPAPTGPAPEPPTVRRVELDAQQTVEPQTSAPVQTQTVQVNRFPSLTEKRTIFSSVSTSTNSASATGPNTGSPVKTVYSKRAKERFAIDESDSEQDDQILKVEDQEQKSASPVAEVPAPPPRSDSAMQVSPVELSASNKFEDVDPQVLQVAATSSSPLPIESNPADSEGTASTSKPSPSTATHTPSTSRSTPTWSDASLRTYMENSQDIKDLLIIVHDKSNVTPVGPDHPLLHNLFSDERSKLAEMQSQLDTMLLHWISKRNGNTVPTTT